MPVLEKIVIADFRNIRLQEIDFSPNINCISGNNGEGKTNLLDAIHYLSMTKSAFASSDRFNFRHGTEEFSISGTYRMSNGLSSRFALEKSLKQGKLSFASPERMERCLGLLPGSVSPFGLINDMGHQEMTKEYFENGHRVKLFLDADLQNAERLSFHPCDNTASTVISNADFIRFLEIWGGEYEWINVE